MRIKIASVITALNFDRKTTATEYVQHHLDVWYRFATSLGMKHGVTRSLQSASSAQHVGEDDTRVLRFVACDASFLIALLAKWCWLHRNAGGLNSQEEKHRVENLLRRLVNIVCSGGGFRFRVDYNRNFVITTEDEQTEICSYADITVCSEGKLDLSKLLQALL